MRNLILAISLALFVPNICKAQYAGKVIPIARLDTNWTSYDAISNMGYGMITTMISEQIKMTFNDNDKLSPEEIAVIGISNGILWGVIQFRNNKIDNPSKALMWNVFGVVLVTGVTFLVMGES